MNSKLVGIAFLAATASLLPGQQGGPIQEFSCAAVPGKTCTYKPTVDGVGDYLIKCTQAEAEPAPGLEVSNGAGAKCTITETPGLQSSVSCIIAGIPSDPQQILIVATCKEKAQSIF